MAIVILGAGVMGSAMTVPLADNGHEVRLVGTHLDGNVIASVQEAHFHPRLRVHLPESVEAHTHVRLGEALEGADLVILGVSSAGVDWAVNELRPLLPPGLPVVMLTKGLRGGIGRIEILPKVLERELPGRQVCAIGGPCIAGELAVRRPTSVTLAGAELATVEQLSKSMRTPYYHIWPDVDVVGVEVCAALKNFYALAVGMPAGMLEASQAAENGARMNDPAAALFAQAIWEMSYLVAQLGGKQRSVWTLAGAGDLYVTCQAGRNSRMGRWLGMGLSYEAAKSQHMSEETVEGAETALAIGPAVEALIGAGDLDEAALPLMQMILDTICRGMPAVIPWERFFKTGPLKDG